MGGKPDRHDAGREIAVDSRHLDPWPGLRSGLPGPSACLAEWRIDVRVAHNGLEGQGGRGLRAAGCHALQSQAHIPVGSLDLEWPLPERDPRFYYEPVIEAIADTRIAVEFSTAGWRKPVAEQYPSRAFAEMCLEAEAPFALSSDAHVPEDVGRDYHRAV